MLLERYLLYQQFPGVLEHICANCKKLDEEFIESQNAQVRVIHPPVAVQVSDVYGAYV